MRTKGAINYNCSKDRKQKTERLEIRCTPELRHKLDVLKNNRKDWATYNKSYAQIIDHLIDRYVNDKNNFMSLYELLTEPM